MYSVKCGYLQSGVRVLCTVRGVAFVQGEVKVLYMYVVE